MSVKSVLLMVMYSSAAWLGGCAAQNAQKAEAPEPSESPNAALGQTSIDSTAGPETAKPRLDSDTLPGTDGSAAEPRMAVNLANRSGSTPDKADLDRKFDQAVSMVSHFEYAKAAPILRPLVGQYRQISQPDKSALSMFWLAYCLEKQAQIEEATVLYREIIRSHDGSSAATQAARRLQQLADRG